MLLTQIVPQLPPSVEGVGSYAGTLAATLATRGIETRFATGAEDLDGAPGPVLLHYANYGYHPRGCPTRLVEGLVRWRGGGAGRRLLTLFHEVWATGPPWRSSFWLAPLQRRLAANLAGLSAGMVTSLELYARMVRPWAARGPMHVMPVFSAVGEPVAVPPLEARAPRLVVFGGSGVRSRTWGRDLPALAAACRELEIEEILDMGPPTAVPDRVGTIPVRALGVLPAEEVGAHLLDTRAGFLSYPPPFLPKSTIFAAYCAHGVSPVCVWSRRAVDAGPLPPFWRPGQDAKATADRAYAWYDRHRLARQAEVFDRMIREETAP